MTDAEAMGKFASGLVERGWKVESVEYCPRKMKHAKRKKAKVVLTFNEGTSGEDTDKAMALRHRLRR